MTKRTAKAKAEATQTPVEAPAATLEMIPVEAAAETPTEAAPLAETPTEAAPEGVTIEVTEDSPAETPTEDQSVKDAEEAYGQSRLKDILAEGLDGFITECRQGLEPAVAQAIFGALLKVKPKAKAADLPTLAKSTCENPTRRVWDIADAAMLAIGKIPSRGEVVKAAVDAGVSTGTARTQFQCWYSARKPEFVAKGWL